MTHVWDDWGARRGAASDPGGQLAVVLRSVLIAWRAARRARERARKADLQRAAGEKVGGAGSGAGAPITPRPRAGEPRPAPAGVCAAAEEGPL